jgi:soluble lytic murein transglycosylase-like protein
MPSGLAAYASLFQSDESRYGLPSGLLAAVAHVESGGNPNAVSPAGAEGLMQLMPGTANSLGVDPFNPTQAVDGAARMLSGLLTKYNGSLSLALAAYNAGPGAVDQYGGVPPYAETQAYVVKVQQAMGATT